MYHNNAALRIIKEENDHAYNKKLLSKESGNYKKYSPVFKSELYTIIDFSSFLIDSGSFTAKYTSNLCMNFTRSGYFTFQSFKRKQEEYCSTILLEKPGCEYSFKQEKPGEGSCTIFIFSQDGYQSIKDRYDFKHFSFFSEPEVFSTVLNASAEADYLHHRILKTLESGVLDPLQMDTLVLELVDSVMQYLASYVYPLELEDSYKKNHLETIERAKEFMLINFDNAITLLQLARHCYISPFYFSRIFKLFTGQTPFQYLQAIRLKHAESLLRTTDLPVVDVCYQSGFSRIDYFSSAFTRRFATPPSRYKKSFTA